MKILVVDDDESILEYLKSFFEEQGHSVVAANNRQGALQKVLSDQPDLVLLDIVLPGKDGIMILKEIKELDKEVSVVMMTAFKDAERTTEAFELGALDYLFKPFDTNYIKTVLLPRIKLRDKQSS